VQSCRGLVMSVHCVDPHLCVSVAAAGLLCVLLQASPTPLPLTPNLLLVAVPVACTTPEGVAPAGWALAQQCAVSPEHNMQCPPPSRVRCIRVSPCVPDGVAECVAEVLHSGARPGQRWCWSTL
jgi:hypothetical protein